MVVRVGQLECELAELATASPACQALISVPGIGLLTSTAMVAAVGDPRSFDSARRYAMLLTHGARSVLRAAVVAKRAGRPIDRLKAWALEVQARTNYNKATCALANKLARIAWAVWAKHEKYQSAASAA